MSFIPVYKCRLCGKEYKDPRTYPGNLNQLSAGLAGLDEDGGYYLNGHRMNTTDSHLCGDGNVGIAELKGFLKDDLAD